jgi:hypothetical protein
MEMPYKKVLKIKNKGGNMKPGEILKFVRENSIEIVDLKFNDLPRLWQYFSS